MNPALNTNLIVSTILSLASRKNPGCGWSGGSQNLGAKNNEGYSKSKYLSLWQILPCRGPRGVWRLVYYQLMARVFENVNNTRKNSRLFIYCHYAKVLGHWLISYIYVDNIRAYKIFIHIQIIQAYKISTHIITFTYIKIFFQLEKRESRKKRYNINKMNINII